MPEFYVEPMKDRQSCSVCQKTVTGKKCLLTCFNCHAITYCGLVCQRADWARHEWNCHPVMVTEFPGKGRGIVAARDIEKGELIFKDKPVIKLPANENADVVVDPDFLTSLKQQIQTLPVEAKSQYYKLMARTDVNNYDLNSSDMKVLNLFLSNSKVYNDDQNAFSLLHLNIALVNHSCAPNATINDLKQVVDEERELRAIKNIRKGEEITTCYSNVRDYGCVPRKRKTAIKKREGFDCKCPVCLGQVPVQEKTLKKLIDLHSKVNPTPTQTSEWKASSDWKKEAGLWSRIVDLTMELYMCDPIEKIKSIRLYGKIRTPGSRQGPCEEGHEYVEAVCGGDKN